jgi:hypothetical protein
MKIKKGSNVKNPIERSLEDNSADYNTLNSIDSSGYDLLVLTNVQKPKLLTEQDDIDVWFQAFNEYLRSKKIGKKVATLYSCLAPTVQTKLQVCYSLAGDKYVNASDDEVYQVLKKILFSFYNRNPISKPDSVVKARLELYNRGWQAYETEASYFATLLCLATKAYPNMNKEFFVDVVNEIINHNKNIVTISQAQIQNFEAQDPNNQISKRRQDQAVVVYNNKNNIQHNNQNTNVNNQTDPNNSGQNSNNNSVPTQTINNNNNNHTNNNNSSNANKQPFNNPIHSNHYGNNNNRNNQNNRNFNPGNKKVNNTPNNQPSNLQYIDNNNSNRNDNSNTGYVDQTEDQRRPSGR